MTPEEVSNWTYLSIPPRIVLGRETGTPTYSKPFSHKENMTAHEKAMAREAKWHPERFEPPVTAAENKK